MTNEELKIYYSNLLLMQYTEKPKAVDTIKAYVDMAIMNQLPTSVRDSFNILTAGGNQLDIIGKYVGVDRVGADFTGPFTLDDAEFRQLIQMTISQNSAGSSLYAIQKFLFENFPSGIIVFDYKDMRMDYMVSSTIFSQQLAQMFVLKGILPRPMGVQLGATIYAPNINALFGFRTYELPAFNASPFNTYDTYDLNWPWLSYTNIMGSTLVLPNSLQSLLTEDGIDRIVQENGYQLFL